MLFLLAVAAAAPLRFHFDATEFGNAAYHAACLTGRLICSKSVYTRFWNEKYHATPEDGARFDEFGKILDEVEGGAPPARATPFLPNDFSNFPGLKLRQQIVGAALGSKSAGDFRHKAAKFANPSQVDRLSAILDYVEHRLRPWWLATGLPIVKANLPGIEPRIRALGAAGLAAEVSGFLETRPDFHDYYLHEVPSPEYDGKEANGTSLLNHFSVEMISQMKPDDLAWVAVHEFTHSLYEQAPRDRKDALMQQFVESGDPSAQPFYMYLNEAVATAVELLLFERNGKPLDDPYTETYIPRLGKAVLPLLRTALEKHQTLYDGFTVPYLAAGRAALGQEADGLLFRYSCVALLAEDDLRSALLERLPLRYFVTTKEEWGRYALLDGILMVRYDQIHFDDDAEMDGLTKKHRGFVYIRRNSEHRDVFMLGRDNAAVEELGKKWAESNEPAREGLIFAID